MARRFGVNAPKINEIVQSKNNQMVGQVLSGFGNTAERLTAINRAGTEQFQRQAVRLYELNQQPSYNPIAELGNVGKFLVEADQLKKDREFKERESSFRQTMSAWELDLQERQEQLRSKNFDNSVDIREKKLAIDKDELDRRIHMMENPPVVEAGEVGDFKPTTVSYDNDRYIVSYNTDALEVRRRPIRDVKKEAANNVRYEFFANDGRTLLSYKPQISSNPERDSTTNLAFIELGSQIISAVLAGDTKKAEELASISGTTINKKISEAGLPTLSADELVGFAPAFRKLAQDTQRKRDYYYARSGLTPSGEYETVVNTPPPAIYTDKATGKQMQLVNGAFYDSETGEFMYYAEEGEGNTAIVRDNPIKNRSWGKVAPGSVKEQNQQRIMQYAAMRGLSLEQLAYILGTVQHETDNTFDHAIHEYGGRNARYAPYYGRGLVQLTWKSNYEWASGIAGTDFVKDPDAVTRDPENAVIILIEGMMTGRFSSTGKGLDYYVGNGKKDYLHARQTVNVMDKASHIAKLAGEWEVKLKQMGYAPATSTPKPVTTTNKNKSGSNSRRWVDPQNPPRFKSSGTETYQSNLNRLPDRKNWKAQDQTKPKKIFLTPGHSQWGEANGATGAGGVEVHFNEAVLKRIAELAPEYGLGDIIEVYQPTDKYYQKDRNSYHPRLVTSLGRYVEEQGGIAVELHFNRYDYPHPDARSGVLPGLGGKGINIYDQYLAENGYGRFDADWRDVLYAPKKGVTILEMDYTRTNLKKGTAEFNKYIDQQARKFLSITQKFYGR